jgi:hypothetical protein
VSAARFVEKYIHQEEQCLQTSELLLGGATDYDRTGPTGQYVVTESSSDVLTSDSLLRQPGRSVGMLIGTTCMYRLRGNTLYITDILDKSGSRSCKLPPMRYDITAVGISESRDPVTRFFLIIATACDVSLFYFNPDDISEERTPTLSGYVAPTGGMSITAISGINASKRIYLGAEDGSVYELVYNLKNNSGPAWPWEDRRRCYLSVLYRPLISAALPPFFQSIAGSIFPISNGQVSTLHVDPCRQLVFVVSGKCTLSVYSIVDNSSVGEISEYTISESIRSAYRAGGHSFGTTDIEEIVQVIPSNPHIGGDVLCVLISRKGARVFVKGIRYSGTVLAEPKCKSCDKFKHYSTPSRVSSISILSVRLPPTDIIVDFAVSPDSGRTIAMGIQDTRGSGIAIVRPDESSVVQRQSSSDRSAKFRERFEIVPVSGGRIGLLALVLDEVRSATKLGFSPVEYLASVSSDCLQGALIGSYRLLAITSEKETVVSPMTASEQLMELVKSENLYSIRDFSIQWRPEQLTALLAEILASGPLPHAVEDTIEKILFAPETASALGLVDAPGLGHSPQPSSLGFGPLGSVVQTQAQNISPRTKGLALFLSRVLRPVWFHKAFVIQAVNGEDMVVIKPGLNSTQRQYVSLLLKPVTAMVDRYRHQFANLSSEESKIVEGLLVLLNAMTETLELLRLFETGQLNAAYRRREDKQSSPNACVADLLEGVDALFVRDVAMSAGVGDPVLVELLTRSKDSTVDLAMAKKHCPLIVPSTLAL